MTAHGGSAGFGGKGVEGDVTLEGGMLTVTGGAGSSEGGSGIYGKVILSGGKLKAAAGESDYTPGSAFAGEDGDYVKIADGKVYTIDGTQFFSGKLEEEQKDAIAGQTIVPYIEASIGETDYPAIQAAMDAADPGDTVKLLKDVKTESPLTVSRNFILDLNGHTIDRGLGESETVINGYVIGIKESGKLTLADNSIEKTGLITGGNNKYGGGGVYVNVNDTALFKITGGRITDNTVKRGDESEKTENVYLDEGKTITINGNLAETTSIGITTFTKPTAESPVKVTSGWKTNMSTKAPSPYLKSDDQEYALLLNDGEIELRKTYEVTVKVGVGSGRYIAGASVTIKAEDPASGKQFKEWKGADDLKFTSGNENTSEATFAMPTKAVTVEAVTENIPAAAPVIKTDPKDLNLTYGYTAGNMLSVEAEAAGDIVYAPEKRTIPEKMKSP